MTDNWLEREARRQAKARRRRNLWRFFLISNMVLGIANCTALVQHINEPSKTPISQSRGTLYRSLTGEIEVDP